MAQGPGEAGTRRLQYPPQALGALRPVRLPFDYLCEHNAISGNPVDGVKRPMANGNEGSPPALGDAQARMLLEAPPGDTLKGVRDRAIWPPCFTHGIRREELCGLRVRDIQGRQGVVHFRVKGKRDKIRFVPVHATAQRLIDEYLTLAGHRIDEVARLLARLQFDGS
jgi:integrase/recombinase XerD